MEGGGGGAMEYELFKSIELIDLVPSQVELLAIT